MERRLLRETVSHLKDLPRYRQILATLIRYGYRDVVSALRLDSLVRPLEKAALGEDGVPPAERPARLRMICEDLGPTFVKLGQVLSTRPDLLPDAYTDELARLRDDVRPFPFAEVEAILTEDLGRPTAEVFASLDSEPLASASISQVHAATLADGRRLALKVRRPGIERTVKADLDILRNLAQLSERQIPALASYRPTQLVREFDRTIHREMDFEIERQTMSRCRTQLARDPFVLVPRAYPEYSSHRVVAMDLVEGVGVDDLAGLVRIGVDPKEVAVRGAKLLLSQIFVHGFFHADPHPGNLRVLPGGVIAPLDYGMFGQLELATRESIADLVLGLIAQDVDRVMRALDELDIRGDQADQRALRRDVGELVSTYSDLTLDTIDLTKLLTEVVGLFRSHRLAIPPDLVLLIRALVTIEGVGRRLDPHFDIARHAEPFLRDLTLKRYQPARLFRRALRSAEDLERIGTLLPEVLGQSLESIKRGELSVKFDLQHFERLVSQLIRASNTLTAGVVVAGLLVGSSLVVQSGGNYVTLGAAGYAAASIIGLWLLFTMFRRT